MKRVDVLLVVVDLFGTFLFGVEGGLAAIGRHLDLFGAMVLAFCTALGGGTIRDLLIGSVPPGSIRDWRYGAFAFLGGGTAVLLYQFVRAIPPMLLITLDAAGLAMFTVAGIKKALNFDIHPFVAVLMGVITGVGGGTLRDVLLAQIPMVLRADVYATAALLGAAVFAGAVKLQWSARVSAALGFVACFALRMAAVANHWNLPNLSAP